MSVVLCTVLHQNALAVSEARRKFKRVPTHEAGLLEFSTEHESRRVPVTVASAASEGMRLLQSEPIADIREGARIDVHMRLDGHELRLPGHVMWILDTRDGTTSMGVELALAVAPETSRRIWASWIVGETERHAIAVRARGSGNHKLADIAHRATRRAKTNP